MFSLLTRAFGLKSRAQIKADKSAEAISNGDAKREEKRWVEAEFWYRLALDNDNGLAHIWMQYGHALKEQGKLTEAEAAYKRSLALTGDTSDGLLQLGHVHKLQGHVEDAKRFYRSSLQLDPTLPYPKEELARLGERFDGAMEQGSVHSAVSDRVKEATEPANQDSVATHVLSREIAEIRAAINDIAWKAERSHLTLADVLERHKQHLQDTAARVSSLSQLLEEGLPSSASASQQQQLEEALARILQLEARQQNSASELPEATRREFAALRDGLSDTVWRAERSFLELSSKLGRQERQAATTQSEVERQIAEVSAIRSLLEASTSDAASEAQRLTLVQRAIERLEAQVAENDARFGQKMKIVDATFGEFGNRIETSLANVVSQVGNDVGGIGQELKLLGAIVDGLKLRLDGDNGHLGDRLTALDDAVRNLREHAERHESEISSRLEAAERSNDQQRGMLETYGTAAEDVAAKYTNLQGQLHQAFGIIDQEIRPLGFLFPFGQAASQAEIDNYDRFISTLAKEKVDACWVCGARECRNLGGRHRMEIVECENCGFMFPNPRVAEGEIGRLYSSQYWNVHQRVNNLATLRDRALYDYHNALSRVFLVKAYRPNGRWLDIGCASGALVKRAIEHGYKGVGLEISADIAEAGKELFGVKIVTGRIETAKLAAQSFDVVTMFDVFEHLYEPDRAMQRVRRILARGGVLIIETFRTDCDDFRSQGLDHPDCKPHEHVGMYRDDHIDRVVQRNGFELVDSRYPQGRAKARVTKVYKKSKRPEVEL